LVQIEVAAAMHNFDFYKNAVNLDMHYEILISEAINGPARTVLTGATAPHCDMYASHP